MSQLRWAAPLHRDRGPWYRLGLGCIEIQGTHPEEARAFATTFNTELLRLRISCPPTRRFCIGLFLSSDPQSIHPVWCNPFDGPAKPVGEAEPSDGETFHRTFLTN